MKGADTRRSPWKYTLIRNVVFVLCQASSSFLLLIIKNMQHQRLLHSLLIIHFFLLSSLSLQAQYDKLDSLEGYNLKVYFSKGQEERAIQMAQLSHNAIDYANKLVHFTPTVTLLILSPADWSGYTNFPVYGMPHYSNRQTLVVAAEENAFWKSFIPPLEQLPPSLANQVKEVYSKDGALTMQPFFDLLALHELGHSFHQQAGLTMQRKWMGELFSNIFLHTYIAENEPRHLAALTVFPNMVVASGTKGYLFTNLEQFESNYNELGTKHPKNYGWYQSRLHVAARVIYDAGGKTVLQKLWVFLQSKDEKEDSQLAKQLALQVDPSIADVLLRW